MSESPVVPRRRLGTELRRLREAAGKTVDDAAKVLECSASKISRLETGKGVPRARDVRDLIELYGPAAEAERERLLRWTSQGQGQGWWNDYRDVLQGELWADHFSRYVTLESDASTIRGFQPEIVHGLLQTEDYIHAVAELFFPESSLAERARFTEFRMRRQDVLRRGDRSLRLNVLLGDAVLRNAVAGDKVMRRQLEHLKDVVEEHSTVTLRVLPPRAALRGAIGGSFAVLTFDGEDDQDVVYIEGREGANYLETEADVARYLDRFEKMVQESLSRADTLARIDAEIRALG